MSRYLQTAVGAGCYLLDAGRVVEIRENALPREESVPLVDLRAAFGETDGGYGIFVLVAQNSGEAVALLVDRVDGLVEVGEAEFCPVPPIGPLGGVIDAIATAPLAGRYALRLRGERAFAVAGAFAG